MTLRHNPGSAPIRALCESPTTGVLAVIVGVEGPSYRPVGAMMAIFADGRRVGMLSSGCIEADLAIHAAKALRVGRPISLRYGLNSPFRDIELPCGGGLDVLLVPAPDPAVLSDILRREEARQPATLQIDPDTGGIGLSIRQETGWSQGVFLRQFEPEVRFLIFGKGPESSTFAALVQSASFPNLLVSPDAETLQAGEAAGCATQEIVSPTWPDGLVADLWTAVVLFFHDHEWEPPILASALAGPSFYVGAQGSQRARDAREAALEAANVPVERIARLRGPIGLVASARDARTLAVSVLAEVLGLAMTRDR